MPIPNELAQLNKIILVCLLSFGSVLFFGQHDFVYDDGVAIIQNVDVTNTNQSIFQTVNAIVKHDFWGQDLSDNRSHKSYRPLVTFMFHLEYRFFNRTNLAATMKRLNLIIHIGVCCTIYDILRRVLHDCHQSAISLAVMLFAAHPIHTEVICSAVGRSDLLCAFFFFATIGQYLEIIREHGHSGTLNSMKFLILFDAALICLLCKEIGIMVLPTCMAYDLLMNVKLPAIRKRDISRRFEILWKNCQMVIKRLVCLAFMTCALVLFRWFCSRYQLPHFSPLENPVAAHSSLFVRFFSSMYVHALNMWLLICPDWLCCDWSHDSFPLIEAWTDYRIGFALILYIFMIRAFLVSPRHIRISMAFLIIPFIPSSHIITIGFVVADRILYIPSIGYCLLISFGLQSILPKSAKAIQIAYLMLLVIFMLRSNERSIDWQNNIKLFTSGVRVCPNNAKLFYNLGQMSALKGNHNQSLKYNLMANELNPNNVATLINLGNAYRHIGNVQAALQHHKEVTSLDPNYPLGWMNLGISYVENGQYEDALAAYLKADELKPNNGKIIFNLGNLYLRMGNLTMAEQMYRKGVKIDPRSHRSHINLIVFLSEHGTYDELMTAIDNAKLHMYDNVPVLMAIAKAFSRINFDFERIEKLYHRILEIDPKNFIAHGHLALQYQKRNQAQLAIEHYKQALDLNPSFHINDERFIKFLQMSNTDFMSNNPSEKRTQTKKPTLN